MKFHVLTLFPEMFESVLKSSIIGKAIANELIEVDLINFRDYTTNKHKRVDDYPYGGGAGMVIQVEPLEKAMEAMDLDADVPIVYLSPKGETFNQEMAVELSEMDDVVFVCGHYEGIDQRFIDKYVTREVSMGDYVLTGGELPTMTMIDAIGRLLPGVLGKEVSYEDESHYNGLLEYPHYTRPADYEGDTVPDVLISGNHKKIDEWRLLKSVEITLDRRPDMIEKLLRDKATDKALVDLIKRVKSAK